MTDPDGNKRAFLWDFKDGKQMLAALDGGDSFAVALNNRGQVVGLSGPRKGRVQAFVWDEANGMRSLSADERRSSRARGINDAGQVVGSIATEAAISPPPRLIRCYWESTEPVATPTTSGLSSDDCPGRFDINNNGYVLGAKYREDKRAYWSFLWRKNAALVWLFPLLDGGLAAFNDVNQVLYSEYHDSPLERLSSKYFPSYAVLCLWDPRRGKVELNNQVPRELGKLIRVVDMNNRRCIVGVIRSAGRDEELALLLEPTPELWDK